MLCQKFYIMILTLDLLIYYLLFYYIFISNKITMLMIKLKAKICNLFILFDKCNFYDTCGQTKITTSFMYIDTD